MLTIDVLKHFHSKFQVARKICYLTIMSKTQLRGGARKLPCCWMTLFNSFGISSQASSAVMETMAWWILGLYHTSWEQERAVVEKTGVTENAFYVKWLLHYCKLGSVWFSLQKSIKHHSIHVLAQSCVLDVIVSKQFCNPTFLTEVVQNFSMYHLISTCHIRCILF